MRRTDTPESDDTDKESVVAKIALGAPPCDIAVSPDSDDVYVATVDSLIVVNGFHHIVARIPVGYEPKWMSLSADGMRLYVAGYDGSLSVIDTTDRTAKTVGNSPGTAHVVSPDGRRIYSAHNTIHDDGGHNSWVSVVDADGLSVATVDIPSYVTVIDVSTDGSHLYVGTAHRNANCQYSSGSVSVIDTSDFTIVETIPLPDSPSTLAVDPDGSRLYVAHYDTNAISNIDLTTRVVICCPLDDAPIALTVAPDHRRLYVTGLQSVAVVDIETNVTETIAVGGLPRHLHFVGHQNTAYIADFSNHKVAELDTVNNTIQATIDVGGHPDAVALGGESLYVADYLARTITVISMAAVTRESKDT